MRTNNLTSRAMSKLALQNIAIENLNRAQNSGKIIISADGGETLVCTFLVGAMQAKSKVIVTNPLWIKRPVFGEAYNLLREAAMETRITRFETLGEEPRYSVEFLIATDPSGEEAIVTLELNDQLAYMQLVASYFQGQPVVIESSQLGMVLQLLEQHKTIELHQKAIFISLVQALKSFPNVIAQCIPGATWIIELRGKGKVWGYFILYDNVTLAEYLDLERKLGELTKKQIFVENHVREHINQHLGKNQS